MMVYSVVNRGSRQIMV